MRKARINQEKNEGTRLAGNARQRRNCRSIARLIVADESGQVIPWVVVMMFAVLATAALVVDVGHAMVIQRELQASADAAALAAAQSISGSSTSYSTVGTTYSAGSGDNNAYTGVSVGTPTVTPLCLTTVSGWGIPCTVSSGKVTVPNAVSVTETATVPTLFAGIFGKPNITLSATSTATNARPVPYNIALIVDSTLSMNDTDSNCGGITQEQCALNGVQQLLEGLNTTYDHVALFTFPNVVAGSNAQAGVAITNAGVAQTFGCTTSVPSSYLGVSYGTSLRVTPQSSSRLTPAPATTARAAPPALVPNSWTTSHRGRASRGPCRTAFLLRRPPPRDTRFPAAVTRRPIRSRRFLRTTTPFHQAEPRV